jgi:hypothetical protein
VMRQSAPVILPIRRSDASLVRSVITAVLILVSPMR